LPVSPWSYAYPFLVNSSALTPHRAHCGAGHSCPCHSLEFTAMCFLLFFANALQLSGPNWQASGCFSGLRKLEKIEANMWMVFLNKNSVKYNILLVHFDTGVLMFYLNNNNWRSLKKALLEKGKPYIECQCQPGLGKISDVTRFSFYSLIDMRLQLLGSFPPSYI
jgi:hypothetical protein